MKPFTTLVDAVTGRAVANIGAEENRQAVARFLLEHRGYRREEITVDHPIEVTVRGVPYRSHLHLLVRVEGRAALAVCCVAGSVVSWERMALAAARLAAETVVPLAVVSDGRTALVVDAATGVRLGEGLEAIPSRAEWQDRFAAAPPARLDPGRREREALIFRSYDADRVNVPPPPEDPGPPRP